MKNTVIIGKQLAYGAGMTLTSPDQIMSDVVSDLTVGGSVVMVSGKIGATNVPNPVVVTAAQVATFTEIDEIFVVSKYPSADVLGYKIVKSPPIEHDNLSYVFAGYLAPAAQTMYIGENNSGAGDFNLPTTFAEGMEFGLVYTNKTLGIGEGQRGGFTEKILEVAGPSDTEATILARLLANFNLKVAGVTCSAVGSPTAGLKFTGVAGHSFNVSPLQSIGSATISTKADPNGSDAVAVEVGSGTPMEVAKLEFDGLAEDGLNNTYSRSERGVWTEASQVDPTLTYNVHTMRWLDLRKGETSSKSTYHQTLKYIAPLGGSNPNTVIKAIFDALV